MNKQVEKWIQEAIRAAIPGFCGLEEVRATGSDVRFRVLLDKSFAVFLHFQMDLDSNRFTVEVGWSERGVFPCGDARQIAVGDDPSKWSPHDGGLNIRLGQFLRKGDYWWKVTSRNQCVGVVREILDALKKRVVPYLRGVAAARRLSLPPDSPVRSRADL